MTSENATGEVVLWERIPFVERDFWQYRKETETIWEGYGSGIGKVLPLEWGILGGIEKKQKQYRKGMAVT